MNEGTKLFASNQFVVKKFRVNFIVHVNGLRCLVSISLMFSG